MYATNRSIVFVAPGIVLAIESVAGTAGIVEDALRRLGARMSLRRVPSTTLFKTMIRAAGWNRFRHADVDIIRNTVTRFFRPTYRTTRLKFPRSTTLHCS